MHRYTHTTDRHRLLLDENSRLFLGQETGARNEGDWGIAWVQLRWPLARAARSAGWTAAHVGCRTGVGRRVATARRECGKEWCVRRDRKRNRSGEGGMAVVRWFVIQYREGGMGEKGFGGPFISSQALPAPADSSTKRCHRLPTLRTAVHGETAAPVLSCFPLINENEAQDVGVSS